MRIDKLNIKNFKGFEDESFSLNPQFTVFIGDNAKGKTAMLQAMSIAMGSFFLGIDGIDSRAIQKNEVRMKTIDGQPRPQKPVVIEAEWRPEQEEMVLWKDYAIKPEMKWKRENIKNNTTSKDAKNIRTFAESLLKASRDGSRVVFPLFAFYGTGRLWAIHEKLNYQKQEEGVKMAYAYALSAKASPKEFLQWFKTQEDSVKKFEQPLDMAHLTAFKRTITQLIPDDRWQDVAFDNKENELTGIFTTDAGTKEKLKFSQLSDGFRNIIAIAGDLAYRCIQLNPHLKEEAVEKTPGIVLIDELDMHLHPNWQRRIVDDLKRAFPKIQFVATTHSPFIVQSLKSDEIWNLDKIMDVAPDKLKIDTIATEVMGVPSPYSEANEALYEQSKQIMEDLDTDKPIEVVEQEIQDIADPAVRAFLQLQKIAKGK
ncbi:AAA family ATPase [Chitinophaga sp. 22536]|uniref:AAA family ATPase n=1 Tax=unclassified Chitinophaga TaxID=2619133 RepID=UPI003F877F4F